MNPLLLIVALCAAEAQHREWLETTPIQGTSREVVVADVRLFAVRDSEECERMRAIARRSASHFDEEVKTYNSPATYHRWRADCEWREQCWAELSTALQSQPRVVSHWGWNGSWSNSVSYNRVAALERLRAMLGDEAFWAGQMPAPTPSYRIRFDQ